MATLQVKGMDDDLYRALAARAVQERRAISRQVARIIQDFLAKRRGSAEETTTALLELMRAHGPTIVPPRRSPRTSDGRGRAVDGRSMYLIDTDILIYSLKGHPQVMDHLNRTATAPKAISVISYGELLTAPASLPGPTENLARVRQGSEKSCPSSRSAPPSWRRSARSRRGSSSTAVASTTSTW